MKTGNNHGNVQEDILKCLTQYGDSLLDEDEYKSTKKKKKQKKASRSVDNFSHIQQDNSLQSDKEHTTESSHGKKRRKKKRKAEKLKQKHELHETGSTDNISVKGKQKLLLRFKAELGLPLANCAKEVSSSVNLTSSNDHIVNQPGSRGDERSTGKNSSTAPVVIFNDPARKKKSTKSLKTIAKQPSTTQTTQAAQPVDTSSVTSPDQPVFDLKRARFEVHKLGIQAFDGQAKEAAQVALAMRLGAKPMKRKYVNYAELQDERKKMKEEEKDKREKDRSMGYKVGKVKSRSSGRKKEIRKVGDLDSQPGSYRGGVQKLSQRDIDSVRKNMKGGGK